jgi:hypothetical protein
MNDPVNELLNSHEFFSIMRRFAAVNADCSMMWSTSKNPHCAKGMCSCAERTRLLLNGRLKKELYDLIVNYFPKAPPQPGTIFKEQNADGTVTWTVV